MPYEMAITNQSKYVIIYYGEMGCGKTYVGLQQSKLTGIPFFDGDTIIPLAMAIAVARFKPISKAMLDDYIHNHLAPEILARCETKLIVAQALYLKEHRDFVREYLEQHDCVVVMHRIRASFFRNLKQLWKREHGLRWVLYWLMNKPCFEED